MISKIKKTVPWTCVISDLNGKEIVGTFYGKELQKVRQEDRKSRIEKVIKRKVNKLCVKWKGYVILLIVGFIKKTLYKMSQYFPKPYEPYFLKPCRRFGRKINVIVDLSNYATKLDLKNVAGIDTSNFALEQIWLV